MPMIDQSDVLLRPPKPSDVDHLYSMFEDENWWLAKAEVQFITQELSHTFLIAEYRGKTIGCINIINLSPTVAYVGNFLVDEPYRGQGIGSRMWKESTARAGERGLILTSEKRNFPMYARLGFKTDHGIPIHRVLDAKFVHVTRDPEIAVTMATNDVIPSVIAYDTNVTSLKRCNYVKNWLLSDVTTSLVAKRGDVIVGYCVMCLYKDNVFRVGPLFADSAKIAQNLTLTLMQHVPKDASFIMDVDYVSRSRMKQVISNQKEISISVEFIIFTQSDVPVDRDKIFFYSQMALIRP